MHPYQIHTYYTCNEIEGLYDEIIITIVPLYFCFLLNISHATQEA